MYVQKLQRTLDSCVLENTERMAFPLDTRDVVFTELLKTSWCKEEIL
ncbi:hypothetical protein NP493_5g00003 [Ridgeia piscesae]|uniref:Uncharacterized protein n=1 Tax=Ridgeia piscesae TaxID=27915 RepID=A0AAD9PFE3_RIDPI|nr:hypothetical protein NP493_5g00003 [Ridgeia piscesae]